MNYFSYLVSIAIVCFGAGATQAESKPRMRLFVIDTSGSMAGKFDDVRQDLQKHFKAVPPSKADPVGIVQFESQAKPLIWFKKPNELESFIQKMEPTGGGTSIGSGLKETLEPIRKFGKKADVRLVLYTDDEDGDPAYTRKMVLELASLFQSQQDNNLNQEVVIRSWALGVSSSLIATQLQQHSSAKVLHTLDQVFLQPRLQFPPQPKSFNLKVTCQPTGKVVWSSTEINTLIYEFQWTAVASGPSNQNKNRQLFTIPINQILDGKLLGRALELMVEAPGTSQGIMRFSVSLTAKEMQEMKVYTTPILELGDPSRAKDALIRLSDRCIALSPLPDPPPRETILEVSSVRVDSGIWYDAPDIAFIRARATINVSGQLPPNAKYVFKAPVGVTRLEIQPDTFTQGEQTIDLLVAAEAKAAPENNQYEFLIEPPPATKWLHCLAPKPLILDCVGPPPVTITPAGNAIHSGKYTLNLFESRSSALVPIRFGINGPVSSRFVSNLKISINSSQSSNVRSPFGADQTVLLPVSLDTSTSNGSYFLDTVETRSFEADAVDTSTAVQPTSFEAEVRTFAPFKRHLCIFLLVCCVIGVPVALLKLFRGFHLEIADPESDTPVELPA